MTQVVIQKIDGDSDYWASKNGERFQKVSPGLVDIYLEKYPDVKPVEHPAYMSCKAYKEWIFNS